MHTEDPSAGQLLRPRAAMSGIYITVFLVLGAMAWALPISISGVDFWMHAGSVQLFHQDLLSPVHTFDEPAILAQRNFAPWQLSLATMQVVSGADTVAMMRAGAVISAALLLIAIWSMARILHSSPWAPLAFLLSLLFVVGSGFGWSGEMHVFALPMVLTYPSTVAASGALLAMTAFLAYLESRRMGLLVAGGACCALVFIEHPLVFVHMGTLAGIWCLAWPAPVRRKFEVAGAAACGLVLAAVWPYFNPYEVVLGALGGADPRLDSVFSGVQFGVDPDALRARFWEPGLVLAAIGPAVLGYFVAGLVKPPNRLPVVCVIVLCSFMWWFGRGVVPTGGYRWAMPTLIALQVAIACFAADVLSWKRWREKGGRTRRTLALVGLVVMVVSGVLYQARSLHWKYPDVAAFYVGAGDGSPAVRWHSFASQALQVVGAEAVVVGSVYASYAMPGLGLRPVVFSRRDNELSRTLIELYAAGTERSRRAEILTELGERWVAIDGRLDSTEALMDLRELTLPELEVAGVELRRVAVRR